MTSALERIERALEQMLARHEFHAPHPLSGSYHSGIEDLPKAVAALRAALPSLIYYDQLASVADKLEGK